MQKKMCPNILLVPEHEIKDWGDAYALYDHRTIFIQRFHAIEEVDGYLCLAAYYSSEITGYLPPAELGIENPLESDLHRLLQMPVTVQVMDIIRKKGLVLLSRADAIERLKNRFWRNVEEGEIREGDIVEGTVISPALPNRPLKLEVYGMEIEIAATEVYWEQWIFPYELQERFPLYQTTEAVIKKLDPENKTVELSLKALKPDPWEKEIPAKYKRGDVHVGTVVSKNHSAAYVRFTDGVVCICSGAMKLPLNEKVRVRIQRVNIDRRKVYGVALYKNVINII